MTEETSYECLECGHEPLEPRKSVENNEVVESGWYCPDCEQEYGDGIVLDWGELDFPVWVEFESYNDHYELQDAFMRQTNIHRDLVPSRSMKYCVFATWWKVDSDGNAEGPYDEKGGELLYE